MKKIILIMLITINNCYAESDNWMFSVTLQGFNFTQTVENTDNSVYDLQNKKLNNGETRK